MIPTYFYIDNTITRPGPCAANNARNAAASAFVLALLCILLVTPSICAQEAPSTVVQIETHHITLNHVSARELAGLLRTLYPESNTSNTWRPHTQAALRKAGIDPARIESIINQYIVDVPRDNLTIIPDPKRHALLIRAAAHHLPKVLQLIKLLDTAPPQVLVDVLIAQVNTDDTFSLGLDLNHPSVAADDLSYQLLSDNVNVFLAALAQTANLNVLMQPELLIRDGTEGKISFTRETPTAPQAQTSTPPPIDSNLARESIQTALLLTPRIHPQGHLTLETILQTNNTRAETQLRLHNHQTVCIGGFASNTTIERSQKLPLLGHLPLLGGLFTYKERVPIKTELIILITPHIIAPNAIDTDNNTM